jgi:hypothetical protein
MVSLFISLSSKVIISCYSPPHPFFRISSNLILQMMNNGNYNINNGDDNHTRNPPSPTLEHVMAIQRQLS